MGAARRGVVAIDPAAAVAAAQRFLVATGHQGTASVSGDAVLVTVAIGVDLPLLAAAGVASTTVSGQGSAHIVRGISKVER